MQSSTWKTKLVVPAPLSLSLSFFFNSLSSLFLPQMLKEVSGFPSLRRRICFRPTRASYAAFQKGKHRGSLEHVSNSQQTASNQAAVHKMCVCIHVR